jgi:hypothetical protein
MKTSNATPRNYFLKTTLIVLISLLTSAIFTSCTADDIENQKQENLIIEMHETFLQRKDSLGNTGKDGDIDPIKPIIPTPPKNP